MKRLISLFVFFIYDQRVLPTAVEYPCALPLLSTKSRNISAERKSFSLNSVDCVIQAGSVQTACLFF